MSEKPDPETWCCNPFGYHGEIEKIKGDLRTVSLKDKNKHPDKPALIPGKFWCRRCRTTPACARRFTLQQSGRRRRNDERSTTDPSQNEDEVFCCDPHKIHPGVKMYNVRQIKEGKSKLLPYLKIGDYWCDKCRKFNPESEDKMDESGHPEERPGPSTEDASQNTSKHISAESEDKMNKSGHPEERPGPSTEDASQDTSKHISDDNEVSDPPHCKFVKRHKKLITKYLRPIKQKDLVKFPTLNIGDYLCSTCYYVREPELAPTESAQLQVNDALNTDNNDQGTTSGSLTLYLSMEPDISDEPLPDSLENSKCLFHKDDNICHENLRVVNSLSTDELYALSWASGTWQINSNVFLCENHYTEFVGKFKKDVPLNLKSCCDPFPFVKHFKAITKNLRTISLKLVVIASSRNLKLIAGEKLCKNCYDRILSPTMKNENNTPELSREASASGSSVGTPSAFKTSASLALNIMGLSPIVAKSRSETGRILYGKRKLDQTVQVMQRKISLSLDVPKSSIELDEFKKARYFDELMEEVKKKLPDATKKEKYQLISLLPSDMTASEACSQFEISRTLFNAVKEAKCHSGILPAPRMTRQSTVLESVKELVVNYFTSDENSRQLPDKNATIRISKNEFVAKRILLCGLKELYQSFQKSNPNLKISFSVFYKLKPKWCVYLGAPGTQNVCVCQYHENLKLVLSALDITQSYRDIIKAVVCCDESRLCMLRLCNKCPNVSQIVQHLKLLIIPEDDNHDDFMGEMIEYNQWKGTDRTELVTDVCTRLDLLHIAGQQFHIVIPHHFIAVQQTAYVEQTKQALTPEKLIINFDFAMNFGCLYVNEVQSYHWGKTQVSLHIGVIFYKDAENNVRFKNICMVSDDLKHDVAFVKVCINKTIIIVKEAFPNVIIIEYLTDGCGQQYKNKVHFYNICHHFNEFGIKASHTFYATSHGKSQCDALAGVIKRVLTIASLKRVKNDQINSAQKAFNFLSTSDLAEKIMFVFVDKKEIELERERVAELDPKKTMKAVPGTRTFHHFLPMSENSVGCKRISEDESVALIHTIRAIDEEATDPVFSTGDFVVVKIEKKNFCAQITDVNIEDGEVEVTLLTPSLPTELLQWPDDLNAMIVPIPHVVCTVQLISVNSEVYTFTEEDKNLLVLKKIIKNRR